MTEQIITWALGIIATLFGGLNIFQWITLRSYKRVKAAEADRMEIENLKTVINTLADRVADAENRAAENARKYDELREKYDKLRDELENYKLNHK